MLSFNTDENEPVCGGKAAPCGSELMPAGCADDCCERFGNAIPAVAVLSLEAARCC